MDHFVNARHLVNSVTLQTRCKKGTHFAASTRKAGLLCVAFVWETKIACVIELLRHDVPHWLKVESQRVRRLNVTTCDVGIDLTSGGPLTRGKGELAERWRNRWRRKGVRRRRRRRVVCMWTNPVRWPGALAGPGGQECAVVCGWDPPLSAPACPPSPHTSRLFILHCGKITATAVSSGFCKVYTLHPHTHTNT